MILAFTSWGDALSYIGGAIALALLIAIARWAAKAYRVVDQLPAQVAEVRQDFSDHEDFERDQREKDRREVAEHRERTARLEVITERMSRQLDEVHAWALGGNPERRR